MINWLVTDMRFAFILAISMLIFLLISFISSHDPSKPLTTLISGVAFIFTFIVIIVTATGYYKHRIQTVYNIPLSCIGI